jgi:hypothetical protein
MTDLHTNRTEGGRRLREATGPTPSLVSIIVVVFRAAHELPPLLESIVAQRGEDIELIVIDGARMMGLSTSSAASRIPSITGSANPTGEFTTP